MTQTNTCSFCQASRIWRVWTLVCPSYQYWRRNSLEKLITRLRTDLGRNDVHVIIGRLSDVDVRNERYPHWSLVRSAQEALANADPFVTWVNTHDLNDGLDASGVHLANDLHYSVEGYTTLGLQFAHEAIRMNSTASTLESARK